MTTDYSGVGRIQYIAGERKLPILDSEYTDKVVLKLLAPFGEADAVLRAVIEGTNGRAKIQKDKELYFAVLDGVVHLFEH